MSDEDAVSGVEALKAASNYLRDPLVAEFAAGGTHITDDGYNILKFHGSYQQDDRDVRNDRRKAGERVRLRVHDPAPGRRRRHPPGAVARARRPRHAVRPVVDPAHHPPERPAPLHPQGRRQDGHPDGQRRLASTLGACGDVNRNVMAAPLPVADPRYATARETALRISEHLLPRTRAYAELWLDGKELARVGPDGRLRRIEQEPMYGRTYLPRKFKTCVTVAGDNSIDLFTHDLGLAGVFSPGGALEGWNVYVGGGLGRTHRKPETFPRLADPLGFVEPGEDLLRVAEAVVIVQRDWGDRTNRRHARLKYTIAEHGIEWFRGEVERGRRPSPGTHRACAWDRSDDRLGWHEQGDGALVPGPADRERAGPRRRRRRPAACGVALPDRGRRHGPARHPQPEPVPRRRAGRPAGRRRARSSPTHGVETGAPCAAWRAVSMACPALPTCGLAVTEAERVLIGLSTSSRRSFDGLGLDGRRPPCA